MLKAQDFSHRVICNVHCHILCYIILMLKLFIKILHLRFLMFSLCDFRKLHNVLLTLSTFEREYR